MHDVLCKIGLMVCAGWTWVINLTGSLLPKRAKRALFAVSVQVKFANRRVLHDATLEKLNAKLNLVHYVDTLDITEKLGKNLLSDAKVDEVIDANYDELCQNGVCPNPVVVDRVADTLISSTPKWLRYGDDHMAADVKSILKPSKADQAVIHT